MYLLIENKRINYINYIRTAENIGMTPFFGLGLHAPLTASEPPKCS